MDDSCAVCAESLEWVAYGPCGHRDVCSTCVARLRFICNDRRCCICKTDCNVVFVTKANGLLTRIINDFSILPSEAKEGRLGSYWYHEPTQAFFDDSDQYKMIKAMCRLSCSVCDKLEDPNDGSKKRARFRNIEQLKGHLFHQHRLLMCSLCLEGRKVFICEQKLYTRAQLNQHVNTGDSEVDGTESERGGFMGHPMCEFCRSPFYGDNELYTHMSTEHYTCHICQRQHPGKYDYYKNYDDLEIHFRRDHFLCEDDACLAKKFIVFQSETEMKRHNTLEHGGRMSRSKRNAALQIPTSFSYRNSEQENRRGRGGRTFRRDSADNMLSMAIQASFETAANSDGNTYNNNNNNNNDISFPDNGGGDTHDGNNDPIIQPFESLAIVDSETPSRYLQAVSLNSRNAPLQESAFPPLPLGHGSSQQPQHKHDHQNSNTMAAHLRRKNNNKKVIVHNSATTTQAWPAPSHHHHNHHHVPPPVVVAPLANQVHHKKTNAAKPVSLFGSGQQNKMAIDSVPAATSSSSSSSSPAHLLRPTAAAAVQGPSSSSGSVMRISHSSSAPNLFEGGSFVSSARDFPPVSVTQGKLPMSSSSSGSSQTTPKINDVHMANKSLVEKIRAALQFDQEKFTAFKDISGEYRQGLMDAGIYLTYVEQFGLTHLVLELAKLCPDSQKQKELVEIYNNANLQENGHHMKKVSNSNNIVVTKKGKGKTTVVDDLADSVMGTVRKLQSGYNKPPCEEEVEILSKDGYRDSRGKMKVGVVVNESNLPSQSSTTKAKGQKDSQLAGGGGSDQRKQQRKKIPKFQRVRLGDSAAVAALLDPEPDSTEAEENNQSEVGLPTRGVWRNGGGLRLVAMTSRDSSRK